MTSFETSFVKSILNNFDNIIEISAQAGAIAAMKKIDNSILSKKQAEESVSRMAEAHCLYLAKERSVKWSGARIRNDLINKGLMKGEHKGTAKNSKILFSISDIELALLSIKAKKIKNEILLANTT